MKEAVCDQYARFLAKTDGQRNGKDSEGMPEAFHEEERAISGCGRQLAVCCIVLCYAVPCYAVPLMIGKQDSRGTVTMMMNCTAASKSSPIFWHIMRNLFCAASSLLAR